MLASFPSFLVLGFGLYFQIAGFIIVCVKTVVVVVFTIGSFFLS